MDMDCVQKFINSNFFSLSFMNESKMRKTCEHVRGIATTAETLYISFLGPVVVKQLDKHVSRRVLSAWLDPSTITHIRLHTFHLSPFSRSIHIPHLLSSLPQYHCTRQCVVSSDVISCEDLWRRLVLRG